jgi:DNA-binding CsgD family transcriptional regulator
MIHLLESAADIRNIEAFKDWTRECVRPIFPHGSLACGYGHMNAGGVSLDYVLAIDYPLGHFQAIRNYAGGIDTPILRRWLATHEPQLLELAQPWPDVPEWWLKSMTAHKLENVAAHAKICSTRCIGTYFSFHRVPECLGERHSTLLRELVPIMHEVLYQVISTYIVRGTGEDAEFIALMSSLSEREKTIMHWLQLGKSNPDISLLTSLKEPTVKHIISRLLEKFGVFTRAQLINKLAMHETPFVRSDTKIL